MNPRVIYTLEHTPMEKWDIMYMVQNSNIEILPYVEKYIMKNFEHVKKMKYVKPNVSKNPIMVPLLEKYPELICWTSIAGNWAAYHIIKKNMHKIKLSDLCANPEAIDIIDIILESLIEEERIIRTKSGIYRDEKWFKTNMFYKCYYQPLMLTTCSEWLTMADIMKKYIRPDSPDFFLIDMFEKFATRLEKEWSWDNIAKNPNALHIIRKYPKHTLQNPNVYENPRIRDIHPYIGLTPGWFEMLDTEDWYALSKNPNAFELISGDKPAMIRCYTRVAGIIMTSIPGVLEILGDVCRDQNLSYYLGAVPGIFEECPEKSRVMHRNFQKEVLKYLKN